jgi:hypothetical protein
MGKSTISMAIFNSYVSLPEGMYVVVFMGWLSFVGYITKHWDNKQEYWDH